MRDEEALRGALMASGCSLKPGETWWDCTQRMLRALDAAGYELHRHNRRIPVRQRTPGPVNPSSNHVLAAKVAPCLFCHATVNQLCVSMSGLQRGLTTYEAHTARSVDAAEYGLHLPVTPPRRPGRPNLRLVK